MPIIARFYGIIIKMYFQQADHNPPHIHVIYGENSGIVDIETSNLIEGDLPNRVLQLVKEWLPKYKNDLLTIWNTQQFKQLPPLE